MDKIFDFHGAVVQTNRFFYVSDSHLCCFRAWHVLLNLIDILHLLFQPQPDANQWNGGYYGYAQGYENYGYAPTAQDPNMYYGGYPGYGNYQQQPQQQQQVGYS